MSDDDDKNTYPKDQKEKEDKLLELAQKRYDLEIQTLKDLDSKAGNLIGYVSVATALILGIGTFGLLEHLTKPEHYILYLFGVGTLAFSIFFSLMAIKTRNYYFAPEPDELRDILEADNTTYENVTLGNTKRMLNAIDSNFLSNNRKGEFIRIAWYLLAGGIGLLLFFAAYFIVDTKILTPTGNMTQTYTVLNASVIDKLKSGEQIKLDLAHALEVRSDVPSPRTGNPWMEITYQWLKGNLTVYIETESPADNASRDIAAQAVYDWLALLKDVSDNPSGWNVQVRFLDDSNSTLYDIHPPDIGLVLSHDPDSSECLEEYGHAIDFRKDIPDQFANIIISCGNKPFTEQEIYNTVSHEFAHTLGLGHAHNSNGDLMCGTTAAGNETCSIPSNDNEKQRPSTLVTNSLLWIYGNDGFDGFSRVLINKPYYILNSTLIDDNGAN